MLHFDTIWKQFVDTYFFSKINNHNMLPKAHLVYTFE